MAQMDAPREGISLPKSDDVAADGTGIAIPVQIDVLDMITALPFERIIAGSACYWGKEVDGLMMPEEGHFEVFGLLPGGAPMRVEVGRNSNGDYNNRLSGESVQGIMAALGLTMDERATKKRKSKVAGETYLICQYLA